MRGTRLTTREIVAEPSGECRDLRAQAVRRPGSTGSLSEGAGTTVDAIAEFLLRCTDLWATLTCDPIGRSYSASTPAVSAPSRYRNKAHLRYIAQQTCFLCGRKPPSPAPSAAAGLGSQSERRVRGAALSNSIIGWCTG